MFAHRGIHKNQWDENTVEAFEDALRCCDGFECDVRLSFDSVPIIVHDHTLLRTHGVDRRVQDMKMIELQKLNIPRVEDIVNCLCKPECRSKKIVFDLKVNHDYCIDRIRELFEIRGGNLRRVIFLIWCSIPRRIAGEFIVLRAVNSRFKMHNHVDGIACKYDGSRRNANLEPQSSHQKLCTTTCFVAF